MENKNICFRCGGDYVEIIDMEIGLLKCIMCGRSPVSKLKESEAA